MNRYWSYNYVIHDNVSSSITQNNCAVYPQNMLFALNISIYMLNSIDILLIIFLSFYLSFFFCSIFLCHGQLLDPHFDVHILRSFCVWTIFPKVSLVEEIYDHTSIGRVLDKRANRNIRKITLLKSLLRSLCVRPFFSKVPLVEEIYDHTSIGRCFVQTN